jgi:hypothetical protein
MRQSDLRSLIDRGRKAGLGTAELYSAMAARRPEAGDRLAEGADGNGYVPDMNRNGSLCFHPTNRSSRS